MQIYCYANVLLALIKYLRSTQENLFEIEFAVRISISWFAGVICEIDD